MCNIEIPLLKSSVSIGFFVICIPQYWSCTSSASKLLDAASMQQKRPSDGLARRVDWMVSCHVPVLESRGAAETTHASHSLDEVHSIYLCSPEVRAGSRQKPDDVVPSDK
jgi:hypothetical protein